MFSLSKQLLEKTKGFFSLLLLIGILKLISFISPLLVNRVSSSVESFGVFEYSFNVGQILIPLLSMGLSGGYAFYVLKHKRNEMKASFHFHFVLLTLITSVVALVYPNILNNIYFGAILIALTFSNQIFIAGIKKIEDRNYSSVLIESGLYLVLLVLILSFVILHSTFNLHDWFLVLLMYNVVLSLFYHSKHIKYAEINKEYFKKIYTFGAKVMLAGLLVFLLCNSTRIFTNYFLNETYVGLYSIIFRIGAASVLIYKTVLILIYKELYLGDYKYLDRIFSYVTFAVIIINVTLFFLFPLVSPFLIRENVVYAQLDNKLILTVFSQIILWVNFSLLEPIFQRENKVTLQIGIISVSVFAMVFLMWIIDRYVTLELIHICLINNLMISLSSVVAVFVLRSNNVLLSKTLIINSILLIITIISVVI